MQSQNEDIKIKAVQINLQSYVYKYENENGEDSKQQEQDDDEIFKNLRIALLQIEDRSAQSEDLTENYQDKYNVLSVKICKINGHSNVSKSEKQALDIFMGQRNSISFYATCPLKLTEDGKNQGLNLKFEKNNQGQWGSIFLCGGMEYTDKNVIEHTFEPTGKLFKLTLEDLQGEKDQQYNLRIDTFNQDKYGYEQKLEQERVGHGCLNVDNEIFILQGNKYQEYNLQSQKLSLNQENSQLENIKKPNLPRSRATYIPYVDEQGKQFIIAIGGFSEYGSESLHSKNQMTEIYNFEQQQWELRQTKSGLTVPNIGAWGFQHPQNKKVYLVATLKSGAIKESQVLEVQIGEKVNFKQVGNLVTKRKIHNGIVKKNFHNDNYTIYIFGENDDSQYELEYFEIKDEKVVNNYNQKYRELFIKHYENIDILNLGSQTSTLMM